MRRNTISKYGWNGKTVKDVMDNAAMSGYIKQTIRTK